MTAGSNNNI